MKKSDEKATKNERIRYGRTAGVTLAKLKGK